jgi:tape measure domain-containing protein
VSIDKLVIEITGDASGLTKALSSAQKNLTSFNTKITEGNRAVNGFTSSLNKSAGSIQRLAIVANELRTAFSGLSRSITSSVGAINRLGTSARTASGDLQKFSTNLTRAAASFERINGASKSTTAALNSMQRRLVALGATVSAINGNMRAFNRTIQMTTAGAGRAGVTINNYGRNLAGAGRAAGSSAGLFNRLNRANITLMEGFRRHVAQITALRTLTYQAIFWFSPLVYSIIKVNAKYETQMQLLKNLSGMQSEAAKTAYALQTRMQLVKLAQTNPFSLDQITSTFVRLKVTGLDPLNGSMQTLMDSIAAFGGSNDELERAGIALQQMVGKSAVSMEELRQQLGEHIPDAMKSMAEGMGISMAEFYNEVKKGTVESKDAINKMMVVLALNHINTAKQMMNTWNGLMARMGTAWQNFVAKIEHSNGGNTFIDTLKAKVQELITFLNTPAGVNFAITVENALGTAVRAFSNLIKVVYQFKDAIVTAAKVFALLWGSRLILGTIMSLIKSFMGLVTVVRAVVVVLRVLTGTSSAAAGAALIFGRNTASAAAATRILSAVTGSASSNLAGIATRFMVAAGAAAALAGAVWLVVSALRAQTVEQRNLALAKSAKEGGAWNDSDMSNKSGDRYKSARDLDQQAQWRKAGGHFVQSDLGTKWVPWTDQREQTYQDARQGFFLKDSNTRTIQAQNVNQTYRNSYEQDVWTPVQAQYNKEVAGVTDPQARRKIDAKYAKMMVGAGDNAIMHYQGELSRTTDPERQKALNDLITETRQKQDQFRYNIDTPNATIAGKGNGAGGGKHKKGGSDTPKRDPLEKYKNKFSDAYVQSADLQHQLDDLVNGTSTEFDAEAARAEGEKIAAQQKDAQSLKNLTDAERSHQEELKKSIKVQQSIIDINAKRTETDASIKEGLFDLEHLYPSLEDKVNSYTVSLQNEYKDQLRIAEARYKSKDATAFEIRQYIDLKRAIDGAVRAKEAELILEKAKDSKQANEDYAASMRSPQQQADVEYKRQREEIEGYLQRALDFDKNREANAAKLTEAYERLQEAEISEQQAREKGDDKAAEDAHRRVVEVTASIDGYKAEAQAAKEGVPVFQERLRQLDEEAAIRKKFGGMGKPLFDWAEKASADFNDLGTSMGNVLTGAMDDFINGLAEGKMAFKDFAKTILKQLILIIIRGLIAKAILSALGLGAAPPSSGVGSLGDLQGISDGTSATGGITTSFGVGHSGMIAGGTAPFYKSVDPAIFSFAERYHTGGVVGLRDGEVPIIAQRGEGVFTPEQMKALGQKNNASPVQVNVVNQTGVNADVERKPPKFDGEKWVETIILKKLATAGPVRDALTSATKR